MERLVEVSEQEVRIDFMLNCKCRANVRLRSLCASAPVAFKVQTSSPNKFLVNPPSGLVSPLSHATLQIILKPQTQPPPAFPRSPSDRFLIKTAVFRRDMPGSTHPEFINSWFSALPHGSTQDVRLKVAFVGPFLLRHAVVNGDCDSVRNILKRQKSILSELAPKEAEFLLRVATELANSEDMVNVLLEAGLRIDARVKLDDNASIYPVDPRWESKGWSELHVVALFDQTDKLPNLIKGPGSGPLDWRDKEGRTPLHLAASQGSIGCAKVLLESGADQNARSRDGKTALYRAAANGNRRMVEILIGMHADPTITDNRGRSPVDVARDKGHEGIVEVLERGEELLTAARRGDAERLERLLAKGASMSYRDRHGLTALHAAAIKGHKDVVVLLLDYGFRLDCEDDEGHQPLHVAVESGCIDTVEVLVSRGANLNAKTSSGATPLYMAKVMGYDGISRLLVSKGATSPSSSSPM